MTAKPEISKEDIHKFLNGYRSKDRIVKIEGDYNDRQMTVFYRDENGNKKVSKEDFYPFVWCKQSAARQFFKGNRRVLRDKMDEYGISCKGLRVHDTEGNIHPRMENGYRVLFYARIPLPFSRFMEFFEKAGRPIYPRSNDANYGLREFITVSPVEQFMIETGYRMFKGYDDYNQLRRLVFDLETEGLEADKHRISQIGIRTNNGFEKIIKVEGEGLRKNANEREALREFFETIKEQDPDIITGYNSENFDFPFIDTALQERHLSNMSQFSSRLLEGQGIYKRKKQQVLKLGGEMEYFFPTVYYGHNITDGLFAVRRAQAIDSNMKKADLKYVTKYSKINKANRVYVPGKIINKTWLDETKTYAFNDKNGHWFKVTDETLAKEYVVKEGGIELRYPKYTMVGDWHRLVDNETQEEFEFVTGNYVVERYLLDDLWETDMIEYRYNETNFLISKLIPVSFEKAATTGTAAIWKYILMAWSYEHDLALPELTPSRQFTGGLARLIKVGHIGKQCKLDFNSLYPSLILSFSISCEVDITGSMLAMLEYILTTRETDKEAKKKWGKEVDSITELLKTIDPSDEQYPKITKDIEIARSNKNRFDRSQMQMKTLANSFFGAYGSGDSSGFNWSDVNSAEETTCTGRMCLRLMIYHFSHLREDKRYNYEPIVGDSFTGDTPLFIKYDETNDISIKPISEIFNPSEASIDALGREYDTSRKDYKVLCRSGWVEPTYIYRHKTNKPIYEVTEGNMRVEVTEDHSLFNSEQERIKPSEVTDNTKLEYYEGDITSNKYYLDKVSLSAAVNTYIEEATVPDIILNANMEGKKKFLKAISRITIENPSKTLLASILYIKNSINTKKPK